jgi:hypothetical protein
MTLTYSLLTPDIQEDLSKKILKICQITKLDMGFQKINMRSRFEKIDFLPQAKSLLIRKKISKLNTVDLSILKRERDFANVSDR